MKRLLLPLFLFVAVMGSPAQSPTPEPTADPNLPNVLLLGDSISFGYQPIVSHQLNGKANVERVGGTVEATIKPKGGLKLDTTAALENLDTWLQGKKWAVIHFNWGLHDLKLTATDEHQVPIDQYVKNLRELVARLKKTGATLIWANTTPIPTGADAGSYRRRAGSEKAYNDAAQRIMEENKIPIDDLHALVTPTIDVIQNKANVHFTKEGSKLMATQVVSLIDMALAGQPLPPITPPLSAAAPTEELDPNLATPEQAAAPLDIPFPKIGQVATRSSKEITASDWAIGCETLDRDYVKYDNYKSYLAPLGAKSARLQAGWAKTEKQPGVYDFTWLDPVIDDVISQGMQPWVQLSYGNRIYENGGHENIFSLPPRGDAALKWDAWATALVKRYKDRVDIWEVWNEPDISPPTTVDEYVDLYIRTAEIIRREDPGASIYALSMARQVDFAEGFLAQMAARGKLDLIDEITFHTYPQNPDNLFTFEKLTEFLAKYPGNKIKLREGENGAPSGKSSGALKEYPWSELTQVKWNLRRMLAYHGHGVPYNLFTICDFAYPTKGRNAKGQLLVKPDGTVDRPKLSYYAAQNTFSIFDNSFERVPDALLASSAPEPLAVYGYRKTATGKPLATVWFKGQPGAEKNIATPVDLKLAGDYSEPVYVDLRTGLVYAIPAENWSRQGADTQFLKIPIYDSPILIADKSTIALKP